MLENERPDFLPLDQYPMQTEKNNTLALIISITDLSDKCYFHCFGEIRDTLQEQLGDAPTNIQILQSLDDGHGAWFVKWISIKTHPEWDLNRRLQELHEWYQGWEDWFREKCPHYFLQED